MGLEQIVAKAIKSLKEEHKEITPEEFHRAFCKQMKKEGLKHEECDKLEKFIGRLDEGYQKLIKSYSPKTIDELIQFLISQVNRLNPSETQDYLTSQHLLILKILKAAKLSRHKDVAKLASTTLDKVENSRNSELLGQIAKEWDSYAANYKAEEFKPLDAHAFVKSYFLDEVATELRSAFEKASLTTDDIVIMVLEGLKPSFTKEMQKELEIFGKRLLTEPMLIAQKRVQSEVKALISKRVFLDNKSIKQKISEIDGIITRCYAKISGAAESNAKGAEKVGSIRKLIDESREGDFEAIKTKLTALVVALDSDINDALSVIKQEHSEIANLKKKIKTLETELESAKEEAGIDFLTKLANRKVLDEELERFEDLYNRFGDNYSVVFFDIDHFKKINDGYGHMAGDVVLASFAQILKKGSRDMDIVGRWGGEEFVAILPKTDTDGAKKYAESIRVAVEHTKFIYKETRIDVTISCGCADRKHHQALKELLKASDEQLYKAKQNGRNRVYPV
ncbi:MAG: diguanylate cyclase [Campylobacterales bacterium]|nr:diguanylate cyclase [Campylobacterales bacterium]